MKNDEDYYAKFWQKEEKKEFRTTSDYDAYEADGDLDKYALNDDDVNKFENQQWVIDGFIPQGAVTVYPSPSNGGKTSIFTHLCQYMVADGYDVEYINVDANGSHLSAQYKKAKSEGWKVLAPDNKGSIKEFMLNIDAIIASNKSLHKKVMIFDVLKKFTDLMSKKDAPHFMAKMKALAARGATIVLLAHTLKYMIEGKLMYDGVGDLRSDCDNMVYLYSSLATHKDAAIKIIETTTYADKTRATFKPMSFRMYASKDGVLVEPLEEVLPCLTDDLRIMLKAVSKALSHDIDTTEDIIKFCITETLHGTNKVRDMLRELVFMDNPKVFREVQQDRKTFKYFMQEFA